MGDSVLTPVLLAVIGALGAFGCAGWLAARAMRGRIRGVISGFLAGTVVLLLILGLVTFPLLRIVDLHSVGIELGIIPSPAPVPPVRDALDQLNEEVTVPTDEVVLVTPAEAAVTHLRAAAWYVAGVLIALVGTSVLAGAAGDRTSPRPGPGARTFVISLIGILTLLVALTAWVWPSLRVTALALADMDQSAGPDVGVNLTEVARHPEAMWGETVTISGLVDRVLGPHALLLGNNKPLVGDKVLLLTEDPLADLVTGTEAGDASVLEGEVAQVTGEVHSLADITPDRLPSELGGYKGQAVLMARHVTLDVPIAGAAGDKEFSTGSDGPELGVTYSDVLDDPERYLGQTVLISAEVEEQVLTSHTFTLGDRGLLAVSAEPRPELFVEATAFVAGEVRRLQVDELEQELGIDLDDALLGPYEGEPVIVVHAVELVR